MAEADDQRRNRGNGRRRSAGRPRIRPNPLRQLVWVLVAIAALGIGYGVGVLLPDSGGRSASSVTTELAPPAESPRPWYEGQGAPPGLVAVPDEPIYPEDRPDSAEAARPYEESLPSEVHVPAAPPPGDAGMVPGAPSQGPAEPSAWRQYAIAVEPSDGRPRIAIVIDDLGVDRRRTAQAIALPAPLTMAFLSYAPDLARQTAAARDAGHELLVHVPMQPGSPGIDPGPNVLAVDLDGDEVLRRLQWGLARFPGHVGINNHMGSRFTADSEGMTVVMSELKRRGLLFLDSLTTGQSVGTRLAVQGRVPFAVRNVFLDNVDDPEAVRARLAETETLARRHGLAIAIGHPRDATLEVLTTWTREIVERGIQLVPVSAVVTVPDGVG